MRSVSSELLGRLWIANTYWPALKIVPNGAIGDSEDFTWPRNARCCDMEDWPDADELDCCRLLEMPGGMAVGCGADNRRAPLPSNRGALRRSKREFPDSRKEVYANLHRFAGSIQRYSEELADPDRYRPDQCPQCEAHCPLRAHGFYTRTLVDPAFDGTIRVRRYLCGCYKRTLSLQPQFALPYLRFGIVIIALYLVARPTHV